MFRAFPPAGEPKVRYSSTSPTVCTVFMQSGGFVLSLQPEVSSSLATEIRTLTNIPEH